MAKKKEEILDQTLEEAVKSLLDGTDFAISTYSNVLTNNRRIPTPIEVLNCILGGGVPFGLITNSYGRSKTGKSTWYYQTMAEFQKEYPEGICFIIDSETSGDPNRARHFGVNTHTVIICCPNSIEEGFLAIMKMLENKRKNPKLNNVPIFGIWDSISNGMATNDSKQSRMNAQDRARVIKNYLGPLMIEIEKEEFFLGLVNQAVSKDIGHGHHRDISGGGIALEHDVHLQTKFESYDGDVKVGTFLVRRTSLMTVDKSKISPEIQRIPVIMDITEGGMIDKVASFVEYMMDLGYLLNSSGWYKLDNLCDNYRLHHLYYIFNYYNKSYRYDEIHEKMKSTPLLYKALRYMFMEEYSKIYKLQSGIMKPYMNKCLKELREEYDSPELYMRDNEEKINKVIDHIKNNPDVLDRIRTTVEFSDAVCLICGKDHETLYKCDCDDDNGVVVTSELAKELLDKYFDNTVNSESEETDDGNNEEV